MSIPLIHMIITIITIILRLALAILILIISSIISFRSYMDREKLSPFECGFDPKSSARIPFSLRFFLLAVIFLVFDVEIALLLPLPIAIANNTLELLLSAVTFIIILILGILHE